MTISVPYQVFRALTTEEWADWLVQHATDEAMSPLPTKVQCQEHIDNGTVTINDQGTVTMEWDS